MQKDMKTVIATLIVSFAVSAADDPFVGTWKMNVEKSRFEGLTKPKAATVTWEVEEGGLIEIHERILADGSVAKSTYEHLFGVEERPPRLSNWSQLKTRLDKNAFEIVRKRDGKVMTIDRWEVSPDKKTVTRTGSGEDWDSVKYSVTAVFERR